MSDNTFVPGDRFEWPSDDTLGEMRRASGNLGAASQTTEPAPGEVVEEVDAPGQDDFEPSEEYVAGEAVTAVPDDAVTIEGDMTIADDSVGVAPDGTVIDASGESTVITTADGVEVSVDADGTLSIDADFTNGPEVLDITTLAAGGSFETESGTVITRNEDGTITIQQANGQEMTIQEDGTVEVNVPDEYSMMSQGGVAGGDVGGPGSEGAGETGAGEPGAEAGAGEGGLGDPGGAAGGIGDLGGAMPAAGSGDSGIGDVGGVPGGIGGIGGGSPVSAGGVSPAGVNPNPVDTDGDGLPDYRDLDSDLDTLPDVTEAGPIGGGLPGAGGIPGADVGFPEAGGSGADLPGAGGLPGGNLPGPGVAGVPGGNLPGPGGAGGGLPGSGDLNYNPVDTDGDGTPDYRDTDSDNDTIPDSVEAVPSGPAPQGGPAGPVPGDLGGGVPAPPGGGVPTPPGGGVPTPPGGGVPTPPGGGDPTPPGGGNPTPPGGGNPTPPGGGDPTPPSSGPGDGSPTPPSSGPGDGNPTPPSSGPGDGSPTPPSSGPGDRNPTPPSSGPEDGKDRKDRRGKGKDFTVDLSDLRDDAAYFKSLAPEAATLQNCWEAAAVLVQHWGLWSLGKGSYEGGCRRFGTLYAGAQREMTAVAQGLGRTADNHQKQEESGVEIAGTINE